MNVSFDFNFWTMLLFIMNFGLAVFVTVSNRSKAANDELKAMKGELLAEIKLSKESLTSRAEKHSERLSRIEADIENSIDGDDMKAVHRRVDEILAYTKNMEGQMSILIAHVSDLNKNMLNGRR
jgi:hypothetical protein